MLKLPCRLPDLRVQPAALRQVRPGTVHGHLAAQSSLSNGEDKSPNADRPHGPVGHLLQGDADSRGFERPGFGINPLSVGIR